jgi:proton glutamate symport protein
MDIATRLRRILGSPVSILVGGGLGLVLATQLPGSQPIMAALGGAYLNALQLCVLPIFALSITLNLARLLDAGELPGRQMARILLTFALSCCVASSLGILVALMVGPGQSDNRISAGFGTLLRPLVELITSAVAHIVPPAPQALTGASQTAATAFRPEDVVPSNVVATFADGNHLGVLFVALLSGFALGTIVHESKRAALAVVEVFYEMFMRILRWLLFLLPVGLMCLVAKNIVPMLAARTEIQELIQFVATCIAVSVLLAILFFFAISYRLGARLNEMMGLVRRAVVVAFFSTSSAAAMPLMLEKLSQHPRMRRKLTLTLVPLSVNLHPFGSVMYFGMATIFTVQLQDASLPAYAYPLLAIGAVAAGMAAGGIPGPAPILILAYVLRPLGVPPEVGVVALFTVNVFIDPFVTAVNVLGNFLATTVLARQKDPLPDLGRAIAGQPSSSHPAIQL